MNPSWKSVCGSWTSCCHAVVSICGGLKTHRAVACLSSLSQSVEDWSHLVTSIKPSSRSSPARPGTPTTLSRCPVRLHPSTCTHIQLLHVLQVLYVLQVFQKLQELQLSRPISHLCVWGPDSVPGLHSGHQGGGARLGHGQQLPGQPAHERPGAAFSSSCPPAPPVLQLLISSSWPPAPPMLLLATWRGPPGPRGTPGWAPPHSANKDYITSAEFRFTQPRYTPGLLVWGQLAGALPGTGCSSPRNPSGSRRPPSPPHGSRSFGGS